MKLFKNISLALLLLGVANVCAMDEDRTTCTGGARNAEVLDQILNETAQYFFEIKPLQEEKLRIQNLISNVSQFISKNNNQIDMLIDHILLLENKKKEEYEIYSKRNKDSRERLLTSLSEFGGEKKVNDALAFVKEKTCMVTAEEATAYMPLTNQLLLGAVNQSVDKGNKRSSPMAGISLDIYFSMQREFSLSMSKYEEYNKKIRLAECNKTFLGKIKARLERRKIKLEAEFISINELLHLFEKNDV